MTMTIADLVDATGIDVLEHLDREAEIPVIVGEPQAQGDIIILPVTGTVAGGTEVPAAGIPIVRGESGGNTHTLLGDGPVLWRTGQGGLDLGTVVVPEGSIAVFAHPEHGFNRAGPGTYRVARQREQADEIRTVAD